MRSHRFITGMAAGLIVGSVASLVAATNMSNKTRREIKQTMRSMGDTLTGMMHN